MLNLFDFQDYRPFLRAYLHGEGSTRGSQSRLARHLGCQPSYLYQVLKGRGDLTEDQAYKVTTFFGLEPGEREYFLVLVRLAKAGTPELREFLLQEMKARLAAELDLKNQSDSHFPTDADSTWNYYFSSALPSSIHLLTSSPAWQCPDSIARRLRINPGVAREHLKKLTELGLVRHEGKRWVYASASLHFPRDSKHNLTMQLLRRTQSMATLSAGGGQENLHYTTLFTLDKKSYGALRKLAAKFVQSSQKTIHAGGTDELYVVNLDLFRLA